MAEYEKAVRDILWDTVEEVEPDEIDLQMIRDAQSNPDCSTLMGLRSLCL